jgi:signal peptidase I
LDFTEILIIATCVFFVIYFFIAQLLKVSGDSMLPTFEDGEQIIAEKVSIKVKPLTRGELIIFRHPQQKDILLIKRVIGLPNETIKISKGKVLINGIELSEPYLAENTVTQEEKVLLNGIDYKIPSNAYVVMGDNRSMSADSRTWGPVSKDDLVGRVVLIYYPLKNFRFL